MMKLIKSMIRPLIGVWARTSERSMYPNIDLDSPNVLNKAIIDIIKSGQPASIGKIGSVELNILRRYLQNLPPTSNKWIAGMNRLHIAGVFPPETEAVRAYCKAFLEALREVDVLGVWFNVGEAKIAHEFCTKAAIGNYLGLEPYCCDDPWSRYLAGKRVLVINPFKDSIRAQYEKRDLIWGERKLLPKFELLQIKMPLSDALVPSKFNSWEEQLDDIKRQMDGLDYDVALVGAGTFSVLITQHAKASGKIGIHLGGATQILFGVYGNRWLQNADAVKLFNEHWVRPLPEETPSTVKMAEDGCYW